MMLLRFFPKAAALLAGFLLITGGYDAVAAGGSPQALVAQTDGEVDETFIAGMPGGIVSDIARQSDGKIVAVGEFDTVVGFPSRKVVRLDVNGNIDQSFNVGSGANANVAEVEVLSDGRIIIGGGFTSFNGILVKSLARLNADGSLDTSFNSGAGPNGTVSAFDIDAAGGVVFGGLFSTVNGVSTGVMARFDAAGNLDTGFRITLPINNGDIYCVEVLSDGKIMVGGSFRQALIRLRPDGSHDTSFVISTDRSVNTVREIPGGLLVGGDFRAFNGLLRRGVVRLFGSTLDTSFNGGPNYINVTGVDVQPDGKVVIGGRLITDDGTEASLLRLNSDGRLDRMMLLVWSTVNALFVDPDGAVVVGGSMRDDGLTVLNGPGFNGVAKFSPSGERDTSYVTRTGAVNKGVQKLVALADNRMMASGGYWTSRWGLVRLRPDGLVDESYDPPLNEFFSASAIRSDGTAWIGGSEENDPVFRFRKVMPNGTLDPGFSAVGRRATSGLGNVLDMAVQPDGRIIAVGDFAEINGQPRLNIVRLLPDGGLDLTFSFDPPTVDIYKVEVDERSGRIFIAGRPGTFPRGSMVYELNQNGSIRWQAPVETQYYGVTGLRQTADGDLLVTGYFTRVNDRAVVRIARLDPDGSLDPVFAPPTLEIEYRGFGSAMELPDGRIMVGGNFWNIAQQRDVGYLARLHSDGRPDPSFVVSLTCIGSCVDPVRSMALQSDGKMIVSGGFHIANGNSKLGLVRFKPFAALVTISGRVLTPENRALRNAIVTLTDSQNNRRNGTTSSFGNYSFDAVRAGDTYTITVASKRYRFTARSMLIDGNLTNFDFVGLE